MAILSLLFVASALPGLQDMKVTLDPAKTRPEIHPYIYGQFIEHLGRCIYGGIWAEMLEDRKFFYPVTSTFKPFRALQNTDFPILGASPWEIMSGSVTMVTDDVFVGDHTPMLGSGATIRQGQLGTIAGMDYVGYIWLKSVGGSPTVTVTFDGQPQTFKLKAGDYAKYSYKFKASTTSDKVFFQIGVSEGDVRVGTASIMPADNVRGMRKDTLKQLKDLGGTIYRWPGGNFVSGYDWRDGIGDRDRRPPRTNPAWGGLEHNDFGTDEFIDFCREIKADPLVTVNTGFGDAYTAAQWVEYCNSSAKTVAGGWRAKNGHRKAYDVKYWCVGNEMWGNWQLGYMSLNHYAAKHNWVSKEMLKIDPSLVLIGSGDLGTGNVQTDGTSTQTQKGWSQGMLEMSGKNMDLISEHFYGGRVPWSQTGRKPLLETVADMKNQIRGKADGHRKLQKSIKQLGGKIIPIAMDEWNYWHRDYVFGELGCTYDLADGLGIAVGLHEYFRQTDIITIATYAQTVNVIGAIKTTRTAAEMESTGLALQLYRRHFGVLPIDVKGNFGDLDVVAALTADKKFVTVGVVNPTEKPVALELAMAGLDLAGAKQYYMTGDSPMAMNSPGKPRQVDLFETKGTTVAQLSCAVIVIPVK